MKKLTRFITFIKVCFIVSLFTGITFATSPAPPSSAPPSVGGGSGLVNTKRNKQCGSETDPYYIVAAFVTLGFLGFIMYILTGKKLEYFDDEPKPLIRVPFSDPDYSDPDNYAYSNPSPKAQIAEPSGASKSIPLQTGSNSIGRDPGNKISLDDPKASRNHADLNVSPEGKYVLTDLGSQNGTTVNGARISQQEIFGGDHIGIGDSSITIS